MTFNEKITYAEIAVEFPEIAAALKANAEQLFCAAYSLVRLQVKSDSLIFPNAGTYHGIEWIVDSDDYGLGDSIRHMLYTEHVRGQDGQLSIGCRHASAFAAPSCIRADEEVRMIWDGMRRMGLQDTDSRFDIVKWYRMMTLR